MAVQILLQPTYFKVKNKLYSNTNYPKYSKGDNLEIQMVSVYIKNT